MAYGDVSLGNMQYQPSWQKLLQDLQQSGIRIDPSQTGGFAPRTTKWGTPSLHASGRAMDINSNANPEGSQWKFEPAQPGSNPNDPYGMDQASDRPGQTVIPGPLAQWAARNNNMKWGGDFQSRSPDPMHFELASSVPQAPMGGPRMMALGGPQAPATDAGQEPTATASIPQSTTAGGGMAPAMAGGGLMNYIQGLGTNPLFLGGLTMLAGQGPAAGAQIANTALTQRRAETLFQQQQTEYNKRQQIWGDAFPNGQPNTAHTLLKGVPVSLAQTIYSMGPEAGLPELAKYQLADATARAAIERRWEEYQKFDTGASPAAPPTAQVAPPTAAPGAAPGPNLAAPAPIAGIGLAPAKPITPETYAPPPALAPPVAAPGAPTRAAAEPTVMTPFGQRTLSQAVQMAERMHAAGLPNDPTLEAAITAARAPHQAALTKQAEMDVAQQQAKPQARSQTSAIVEGLDRMDSLAKKIHDSPALWRATGFLSSPGADSAKIPIPFTGTGIPLRPTVSMPGMAAHDVERDMKTLAQQIGLSTLQALKQASANGGSGLGSTSEQEINMLQNAIAGIGDPSISTEKYRENLKIIQTSSQRIRERVLGAWQETYGEPFREASGKTPPGYPTTSETAPKQYEINVAGKKRKYIMGPSGPEWAD